MKTKPKSRIPKFGTDANVPGPIPKDQQLFKCATCGNFRRMTDKIGYACTVCVATPGEKSKEMKCEE